MSSVSYGGIGLRAALGTFHLLLLPDLLELLVSEGMSACIYQSTNVWS